MQVTDTATDVDVIVVGAGMVGAALALGLGRQGWRVALVERVPPRPITPQSDPDLRVSALNDASEALLRRLGTWAGIESARLAPFSRLAVWEALDTPFTRDPKPLNEICFESRAVGRLQFGHIVENSVTQWALWEATGHQPHIERFCPDEVSALEEDADGVTLELKSGKRLKARLLVGADGAASKVRQLARIGISREQYDQQALVASVIHAGDPQDITWQAFTATGPRAYLPLPAIGGRSWASLVWYDSPERIAELKRLPETDFIAELQAAFPERLPPLEAAPARASFPLAKMQAKQYFRGRTVLVGDAAHTINPMAGQGVNLGFQDVDCLLALLEAAKHQPVPDPGQHTLLSDYERRQRPANQRMIWLMDLFYHTFSNRHRPLQLARNLGLFTAQRLPFGKEMVARYAMGITPLPASLSPRDLAALLPAFPGPGTLLRRLRPRDRPAASSSAAPDPIVPVSDPSTVPESTQQE